MRFVLINLLIIFLFALTPNLQAQVKTKSAEQQKKELRKKKETQIKKQNQAEKQLKVRHKDIQDKATRKRMKKTQKRSKKANKSKRR
jgi:biopolymer transport protein ExbD